MKRTHKQAKLNSKALLWDIGQDSAVDKFSLFFFFFLLVSLL